MPVMNTQTGGQPIRMRRRPTKSQVRTAVIRTAIASASFIVIAQPRIHR